MSAIRFVISRALFCVAFLLFAVSAYAITLQGPVVASSVTISGGVSITDLTVGTMTISSLTLGNATSNVKGAIMQIVSTSTIVQSTSASSTPVAVPGFSATITLSSPLNYIRISLSGILESKYNSGFSGQIVNLYIQRDSINLFGEALLSTNNIEPVGIRIVDVPGDTDPHTYRVLIDNGGGSTHIVGFTANPVAWLLLEEIAR